jgi:hypothetical protein
LPDEQGDDAVDERDEAGASVGPIQRCPRCGQVALLPGRDEYLAGAAVPPEVMCEYCVTPLVFDVIVDDLQARVREYDLRRRASKQGLRLMKSYQRDGDAIGYGSYMLVDPYARMIVASGLPGGYGLDLDGVERYLDRNERPEVAVAPREEAADVSATPAAPRPLHRRSERGRWPWPAQMSAPTRPR